MDRPPPLPPERTDKRPLAIGLFCLLILGLGSLAHVVLGAPDAASKQPDPHQETNGADQLLAVEPMPPKSLMVQIDRLGRNFEGKVGIAIHSVDYGWTAAFRGASLFPQQSVSKLWVALTVLEAVDAGNYELSDNILVQKSDLALFHQPISERIGPDGLITNIEELLRLAITQSDNAANDLLLKHVGGPDAVRATLRDKQIDEVGFGPGDRIMQTEMAGLEWRAEFSTGRAFWTARDAVPEVKRREALRRYIANPPDAATPDGMVHALAGLSSGELLSPTSTAFLVNLMKQSKTGPERLKGGLAPGWTFAHKTGTGQVLGAWTTAYNDVGILESPKGRRYAVAVLIAETSASVKERQRLMSAVTRTIIACDKDPKPCN